VTPRGWRAGLVWLALCLAGCAHGPAVAPVDLQRALSLEAVGPVAYEPRTLDGKVLLIDFFATWCFPCVADLPALESLQKQYGPKGFTVVAVGMDLEGPVVLDPFAQHYALSFPVLVASEAIRQGAPPFGQVRVLPTTMLVGRKGEVLAAYQGVADHEVLARAVEHAVGD
jgi:thiol-disulfide isomerase/thioredoxin